MAKHPERGADRIASYKRSDAALRAQRTGPGGVHARGCAIPGVFHCVSGAGGHGRAAESWESVCGFANAERVWEFWRTGFRGNVRRGGDEGIERGLVAEVACTPAAATGSDRRHSA